MATPDSDDSNLPKEPGNKVYGIINCAAIYFEKGASGNAFLRKESSELRFQEVEVSKKLRSLKALKETVRHVYFLNHICS